MKRRDLRPRRLGDGEPREAAIKSAATANTRPRYRFTGVSVIDRAVNQGPYTDEVHENASAGWQSVLEKLEALLKERSA